MARLVNRFHCHSTRQGRITDESHDMMILTLPITGDGHAEGRGQGCRSVAGTQSVVLGFISSEESAYPAVLFYGWQQITSTGQNFVRVSLMTNVPNESISRRVEGIVKGHGELDGSERRAGMPPHAR